MPFSSGSSSPARRVTRSRATPVRPVRGQAGTTEADAYTRPAARHPTETAAATSSATASGRKVAAMSDETPYRLPAPAMPSGRPIRNLISRTDDKPWVCSLHGPVKGPCTECRLEHEMDKVLEAAADRWTYVFVMLFTSPCGGFYRIHHATCKDARPSCEGAEEVSWTLRELFNELRDELRGDTTSAITACGECRSEDAANLIREALKDSS